MSPVPFSPISVQRYPASPSMFDFHPTQQQQPPQQMHQQHQKKQKPQQQQQQQQQLHPDQHSSVSAATAEIVAQQSQDYIDEQLAEFQNQIYVLQGRTEGLITINIVPYTVRTYRLYM